ncbi:DUF1707 domain-containing protein [Nocardioides sp. SYSU D00038]|uniref:DUF1707 SHOCT-like domain-containing protein n=1 Tax=Nocardioides sp. SYSU D00038 TaxID=2812554 RepID=UPI001967C720|nr:DUF1707 domain-containing protein [Nocardioides sp. SYSU D00038]
MVGELRLPDEGDERSRLRISDADRHQVAEVLRDAAGEGRLDLDELDQRLEAAYAAKVYADLAPLVADLPSRATTAVAPGSGEQERHFAVLSGLDRTGVWTVPARMTVVAMMGGANLDLRLARFAAPEVVLTVNAVMGGAHVVVGPDVDVVIEGTGIMGGYSGPSGLVEARLGPSSPRLRVRGFAFWGGVNVERKHRPDGHPGLPG